MWYRWRLPWGDCIDLQVRFDLTLLMWGLLQVPVLGRMVYLVLHRFLFLTF